MLGCGVKLAATRVSFYFLHLYTLLCVYGEMMREYAMMLSLLWLNKNEGGPHW